MKSALLTVTALLWLHPLAAQHVEALASAPAGLARFQQACAAEGARLWGVSLCGPTYVVDPATRTLLASDPDSAATFVAAGDFWSGTLPADIAPSNTAVVWGGRRWAMVMAPLPADSFSALTLLVHEHFHRIQPELEMVPHNTASPHLDSEAGRVWLRLELRALARALETRGDSARHHARNALVFRATRRAGAPGADTLESQLELNEGLAQYTGVRVALDAMRLPEARAADMVRGGEAPASLVRSFAYATGPALGLLLDRWAKGWRAEARRGTDPATLLARTLKVSDSAPPQAEVERLAAPYGFDSVRTAEKARTDARDRLVAGYRSRLVEGPILLLRQDNLNASFDPYTVVLLGTAGTVYPTGTFSASWGTLTVREGGALVGPDWSTVRVAAPLTTEGNVVEGPGWSLQLAPGWTVRPGARTGDLEIARPQ